MLRMNAIASEPGTGAIRASKWRATPAIVAEYSSDVMFCRAIACSTAAVNAGLTCAATSWSRLIPLPTMAGDAPGRSVFTSSTTPRALS
jgi:hypothetical protein